MATIKYENLDIENVDVKEEVDSLENRHHDDVGETRLENIQGQDPLEPALSLDIQHRKLPHSGSRFLVITVLNTLKIKSDFCNRSFPK